MTATVFKVLDQVQWACDPRHAGTVEWVNGHRVGVLWSNGWCSTCRLSEIRRAGAEVKRVSQ